MKLTTRQRQIVSDIAAGLTNKEIAAHLRLRETTIKWHIARMMRQAGAANRASLVEMFYREGPREERGKILRTCSSARGLPNEPFGT